MTTSIYMRSKVYETSLITNRNKVEFNYFHESMVCVLFTINYIIYNTY